VKVLVVGASGFVGNHLVDCFLANSDEVYTSGAEAVIPLSKIPVDHQFCGLDILDSKKLESVLSKVNPEYIVHLAAQSSVAKSWENPSQTMRINVEGPINLLDAMRTLRLNPRVLLIGSSEEYGKVEENENPIMESRRPAPMNPYAISKYSQEQIGTLYAKAYGMDILMTRSFNHFGPGQGRGFAVPDFCSQIVSIERGEAEPVIKVGNIDVYRDFTDVRDVVKAYRTLLAKGKSGEIYNVGSGKVYSIKEILITLIQLSSKHISYEISPGKLRPVENIKIQASIDKITTATGWKPQIKLDETLKDSLEYWRNL
jgi:GDP-4-dehydro-6-deoxy-D-mannose reductase